MQLCGVAYRQTRKIKKGRQAAMHRVRMKLRRYDRLYSMHVGGQDGRYCQWSRKNI